MSMPVKPAVSTPVKDGEGLCQGGRGAPARREEVKNLDKFEDLDIDGQSSPVDRL